MILSPHSNSIFIKHMQESFVPVSATDTYSCVEVYLHPFTLVPYGEIYKFSLGLLHPGENFTGCTWDKMLGFVEEISFLYLPGVEPRFFGLSVCTLLCVPIAVFRFFIWTSIYIHILPFVCLLLARQPPMGHGLLIIEDSRSQKTTHHSR